jgi:insertion element IS1 protein InsB
MWSSVGSKRTPVWIGLAMERAARRIVGVQIGERTDAGCRLLRDSLPTAYRRRDLFFTDGWESCGKVFQAARHAVVFKQSGLTGHIERFNNALRQRCAGLVRKTLSFSKDFLLHAIRIQMFIDHIMQIYQQFDL